jgi:S1-C subfamily serine protease
MGKRADKHRGQERKLSAGPQSRREVFRRIRAAVVGIVRAPADIDAALKVSGASGKNILAPLQVVGSGYVYDESGLIITAAHVIQPWIDAQRAAKASGQPVTLAPPRVLISEPAQKTSDTGARMGFVLGAVSRYSNDPAHDLIVLGLAPEPNKHVRLSAVRLAGSAAEEGDEIAVCGYPLGNRLHGDLLGGVLLQPSFSGGIVSAVVPFSGAPVGLTQVVQISAMVNPGNSGGPAFDVRTGDVIGTVVSISTVSLSPPGQPNPSGLAASVAPTGLARVIPATFIPPLVKRFREFEATLPAGPQVSP